MLDIPPYGRKYKSMKPIDLMKDLYQQYTKSIKKNHLPKKEEDIFTRRVLSLEKFNYYVK
jgi:hypothetical protein